MLSLNHGALHWLTESSLHVCEVGVFTPSAQREREGFLPSCTAPEGQSSGLLHHGSCHFQPILLPTASYQNKTQQCFMSQSYKLITE